MCVCVCVCVYIYSKNSKSIRNTETFSLLKIPALWIRDTKFNKEVPITITNPYHSLASGQTTGSKQSPTHQQKIGLKIYWAWPHPSEQDSDSPTVSLSHQEASICLLSSIRGQTEWKPQSQKTKQTDHMDQGGGFRMGNTCIPVADSFWCLAKLIQLCKV